MALETLALGVQGKLSLWKALAHVADQYSAIRAGELDELIKRAQGQYDALERERSAASAQILNPAPATARPLPKSRGPWNPRLAGPVESPAGCLYDNEVRSGSAVASVAPPRLSRQC